MRDLIEIKNTELISKFRIFYFYKILKASCVLYVQLFFLFLRGSFYLKDLLVDQTFRFPNLWFVPSSGYY